MRVNDKTYTVKHKGHVYALLEHEVPKDNEPLIILKHSGVITSCYSIDTSEGILFISSYSEEVILEEDVLGWDYEESNQY